MTSRRLATPLSLVALTAWLLVGSLATGDRQRDPVLDAAAGHLELPDDPFEAVDRTLQARTPRRVVERGGVVSVQVNVDENGDNIVGDAANEPSIAVDPNDPSRMVIGWRQFDTVSSNFRQAGVAYSHDGGETWTFPFSIDAGIFRSDPVLAVDNQGVFYYYALGVPGGSNFVNDMFLSTDGGMTWGPPLFTCGGDKAWFTLDRTGGQGEGHLYAFWTSFFTCQGGVGHFNRSTDGAFNWDPEINVPQDLRWGTLDIDTAGNLYLVGTGTAGIAVVRSSNAQDDTQTVIFDQVNTVDLGGFLDDRVGPNPGGLLGQAWIAVDQGDDALYVAASVNPPGADPLDASFSRSTDGGVTWSPPVRVNDDTSSSAYQWFGTMSAAPNGRIDYVWNDTRNDPGGVDSELFYSYSLDGGLTWAPNQAISPAFDPLIGHPQQNKIGDYYHMVSFDDAAHLAWSATFNGEQDVYYTRIPAPASGPEIFEDGFESGDTSAWTKTTP